MMRFMLAVMLALLPCSLAIAEGDDTMPGQDAATAQQVADLDSRVEQLQVDEQLRGLDEQARDEQLSKDLDAISSGIGLNADSLVNLNDKLDQNNQMLNSVSEAVNAEPVYEQPEQMSVEDLMLLLPENSPTLIADYMMYPFAWGILAGVFGYLISLALMAFYRLLGFN